MPGTSQLTTSFKLTLIGVIALCPILGIFLGMLLGSWKGLRLGGSIVGGVVGACIAIGITITLVMNYQQTLRQQLETSRRWDYLRLVDAQLNLKRHVEAAQSAAELSDIFPDNSDNAFAAAGCLARCLPVAEQDTKLTESDRAKLIEKYGHDAVSMLREAVRRGYQDVAQMKRHTDLDPIRERQDFQELLVEIQNKEKRGIGR